jgi:predicted metal-dependent hydrolase
MDTRPVAIIAGSPPWGAAAARTLEAHGFAAVRYGERTNYVARLADDHAALILIDGDAPGWESWATLPKVSPATRRIPVVVVAEDGAVRGAARTAGADIALAPEGLSEQLPAILAEHARTQDAETARRLAGQCSHPLPPQARQAVELFNAGEYYRQHDLFEMLWMEEEGPVRDLYRAILQVGIAYYQVQRDNRRGALKMLLRSVQWLNVLPDVCQGVDIARLRGDVDRLRAALEALPEGAGAASLDPALLGRVHLVDDDT